GKTSAGALLVMMPSLRLVVVFNGLHQNSFVWGRPSKFQDQPPLFIDLHRALMSAVALQFFKMQALERVKISFVRRSPDDLHELSETFDDLATEPRVEAAVCLQPVQPFIVKVHFHLPLMTPI